MLVKTVLSPLQLHLVVVVVAPGLALMVVLEALAVDQLVTVLVVLVLSRVILL
jgi:hypothetical protein